MSLLLAIAALATQETQTFNNAFDPYVAVLTELPKSATRQEGSRAAVPFAYISTFRVRKTGQIQQYLKLELEYVSTLPIDVSAATYVGGEDADFEVITKDVDCQPSGRCKTKEVLSVLFPFVSVARGDIRVQFRNRTASWRGTVIVPSSVLQKNLAVLRTLK